MKVLVTGGGGMVGRTLSEVLTGQNHDVYAPTRQELDLMAPGELLSCLRDSHFDAVVHAAGRVGGIEANIDDPVGFLHQNMIIGMNVVNESAKAKVPKLINLGSSCMYPKDAPDPLEEESILSGPLEPTNEGYALAKIATAKLAQYYRIQYGCNFTTIIPCNLYGPYDKFGKGAHMIPAVIAKIHDAVNSGSDKVTIWGDGTARREFMFSVDLARVIDSLLCTAEELPDMMNVGTGIDFTVQEYYQEIARVVGFEGHFEYDLTKPTGMKRKRVDLTRLEAVIDISTTDLDFGISETYRYFLERESK